jgi:hypothetical protein
MCFRVGNCYASCVSTCSRPTLRGQGAQRLTARAHASGCVSPRYRRCAGLFRGPFDAVNPWLLRVFLLRWPYFVLGVPPQRIEVRSAIVKKAVQAPPRADLDPCYFCLIV